MNHDRAGLYRRGHFISTDFSHNVHDAILRDWGSQAYAGKRQLASDDQDRCGNRPARVGEFLKYIFCAAGAQVAGDGPDTGAPSDAGAGSYSVSIRHPFGHMMQVNSLVISSSYTTCISGELLSAVIVFSSSRNTRDGSL